MSLMRLFSKESLGEGGNIQLLPLLAPGEGPQCAPLTVSERPGALLSAVTGLSCQPHPP